MDEKTCEAVKYLYGCLAVEREVNLLYVATTKNLPFPELNIVTTAIAHDNLKHAAVIQELRKPLLDTYLGPELSKESKKIISEITELRNTISMEANLDEDRVSAIIQTLSNVEDYLNDLYANFIESGLIEDYSRDVSVLLSLTSENMEYIVQVLKQDNL
jgi:hypothetical protein